MGGLPGAIAVPPHRDMMDLRRSLDRVIAHTEMDHNTVKSALKSSRIQKI
jgi:hypothetical protein